MALPILAAVAGEPQQLPAGAQQLVLPLATEA
jgi:hypothetical protein